VKYPGHIGAPGDLAEGAFEADVGLLGEGFAAGVGRGIFLAHAAGFAAVDAEAFLEDEDGFQAGSEFLFAARPKKLLPIPPSSMPAVLSPITLPYLKKASAEP